jgi:holo-[acyl-carrier protein] synthase
MIHSGIDLILLQKIKNILLKNENVFLDRICTSRERESLNEKNLNIDRKVQKVAALFSIKESFSKALGVGIGADLSFQDIQVSYLTNGKPMASYLGNNPKFKNLKNLALKGDIAVSVSHEEDLLTSIVVINGNLT